MRAPLGRNPHQPPYGRLGHLSRKLSRTTVPAGTPGLQVENAGVQLPTAGSRAFITRHQDAMGAPSPQPLTATHRADVASCVELSVRNGVEV